MKEIKRESSKYPFRPTEKEMHAVDMFNNIELLKSYLKVEIKRLEDILESSYGDYLSDEYDQGRMEAFSYVLSRLDESSKEEE